MDLKCARHETIAPGHSPLQVSAAKCNWSSSARERPHCRASAAHRAVLEQHAHDGHHGQTAIRELGVELPLPPLVVLHGPASVRDTKDASVLIVTRIAARVCPIQAEVNQTAEDDDLRPAEEWHLAEGRQAVRDLRKLHALGWRAVPWPLVELRNHIPDGCEHGDTAVLELDLAAALEGVYVPVLGEPGRIPEADRGL